MAKQQDFSMELETKRFNKFVKRFIKNSSLSTEVVIKKIAFDLLMLMLTGLPSRDSFEGFSNTSTMVGTSRHPVDQGRARAGWYASVEGLGKQFNFDSGIDPTRSNVAQGKREGRFKNNLKAKYNKWVELINTVKYIVFLEHGWSKQAPAGMLRISMRKMRGKMPKELNKAFLREWNKIY